MNLLLMRHAEAEAIDAKRYPDDDLRPLSALGVKVQADMAHAFRRMSIKPDHILSSPRVRALDTARLTAKGLGLLDRLIVTRLLGSDYELGAVVALLADFDVEHTVMCVGHEPDLRELASCFLGITASPGVKFSKSGIMRIDFNAAVGPGLGILRYFYRVRDVLALN